MPERSSGKKNTAATTLDLLGDDEPVKPRAARKPAPIPTAAPDTEPGGALFGGEDVDLSARHPADVPVGSFPAPSQIAQATEVDPFGEEDPFEDSVMARMLADEPAPIASPLRAAREDFQEALQAPIEAEMMNEDAPDLDAFADSVAAPEIEQVMEPPIDDIVAAPVAEDAPALVMEALEEPVMEALEEPVAEFGLESAEEPAAESVTELAMEVSDEPVAEIVDEPVAESELLLEPVAELIVETPSEPAAPALETSPARIAKAVRLRLPDERDSVTHKFSVGGQEGYLTVGLYPDTRQPAEIFVRMSKEGSTTAGLMDGFATAISLALQYGVPLQALVGKFIHSRFEPSGLTGSKEIPAASSVIDYIFQYLALRFLSADQTVDDTSPVHDTSISLSSNGNGYSNGTGELSLL